MKRTLLLFCTLFFTALTSFGQTNFEYGYYIDKAGNKTEAEISEINIYNIPEQLTYRQNNSLETIAMNEIDEVRFGTDIFKRMQFQYDPTIRFGIDEMPKSKEAKLIDKTDFLQLLVDGDYKLYKYIERGVPTFIYENPEGQLVTLIYKKSIETGNQVRENNEYIEQLFANIKNPKRETLSKLTVLKYTDQDLETYFQEVNGKTLVKVKKSKLTFNFFVGYASHTMDINFLSDISAETYGHITVMPEVEYLLNAYVKNPFGFYANVKWHQFKKEFVEEYEREDWHHKVDYQSLYVAFGAKKYLLSSENVRFYGKLGVGLNNPIKSKITSPIESWILNPIMLDRYSAGINAGIGAKLFSTLLIDIDYDYVFNTPHINKNQVLNFKIGYAF